jgi:hypothetical protein
MITRDELAESEIRAGKIRQRWIAPEVTRLNFPKTANQSGSQIENDAPYSTGTPNS